MQPARARLRGLDTYGKGAGNHKARRMTPEQIQQAVDRAQTLLERTSYFEQLGLHAASADARMCARHVLELAHALNAEHSARLAMQTQRDAALERILQRGSTT